MTPPPSPPIDVAIAIVRHRQRLLVCQRPSHGPLPDFWEFPGGKCRANESLQECLHRELHEELAITVHIDRPLPPIPWHYPHALVRLHPFLCTHRHGDPRPLQCRTPRWITPQELSAYPFPPANQSLLQALQQLAQARQLFNDSPPSQ